MRADQKKSLFLEALAAQFGHISKACEIVKMPRSTYHYYMVNDPEFRHEVEMVEESFIDICESKLRQRIMKDEWVALRYYLENRASKRWRNTDQAQLNNVNVAGQLSVHITKEVIAPDAYKQIGVQK